MQRTKAFLGVDIGTSSSKGVLVDGQGNVLASQVRQHQVDRPYKGWAEMEAHIWWSEFCSIVAELTITDDYDVIGVGVSGMGPCVLVTDGNSRPLRPAILYGVDTRATAEIAQLTTELGGRTAILEQCGSALSTQAVGPKLEWLTNHEPHVAEHARRLYMPSSWLAFNLTGIYGIDHHSASQCTPLYDADLLGWHTPWVDRIAPAMDMPPLSWPSDILGTVHVDAARQTGLPAGIPVCMGTIDAWAEAVSVGATKPGDLMLMYGTTMFLVHTVEDRINMVNLWGTNGAYKGTHSLAGGMATSGAITNWLRELFGSPDYSALLAEAESSGVGAGGLLMLPYFAGERTPIADPDARGVIAGLTLSTTRGDLYRAALEATAFGIRHNIEEMESAGGSIKRIIAVGGGTQGGLWTQIVSDVTGVTQTIPATTIGASYGAAYLIAKEVLGDSVQIDTWNPPQRIVSPNDDLKKRYDSLYALYRDLHPSTADIQHRLSQQEPHHLEMR